MVIVRRRKKRLKIIFEWRKMSNLNSSCQSCSLDHQQMHSFQEGRNRGSAHTGRAAMGSPEPLGSAVRDTAFVKMGP